MSTSNRSEIDTLIPTLVAQSLPGRSVRKVEPVQEGVSTYVYRLQADDEILYLRILPELDASFAPEVLVHRRLGEQGVRVPAVVHYEACHSRLGRSLMVTTEIRGQPLSAGAYPPTLNEILMAAGRELAIVNTINVTGAGWVRRDRLAPAHLCGEQPTISAWIDDEIQPALDRMAQAQVLTSREIDTIRAQLTRAARLFGSEEAHLVHGDFDLTHIYHVDGEYSGLIDFGEIRGANRLYDLGHFQIENRALLPHLLAGYAEQTALPADYRQQIDLSTLLAAVHWLGRSLAKRRPISPPLLAAVRLAMAGLAG